MPYKLRKAPKRDLYWVIGADGSHKSKEPLPKEQAEAQMRALYAAMGRKGEKITGGMINVEEIRQFVLDNYDEIKDLAEHVYNNRAFYYAMLRRFGGWIRGKWEDVKRFIRERMGRRGAGITIPKDKFIKEHTNLLKVLKKGNPAQLRAEYKDQAEELAKVIGGGPIPDRNTLHQLAKQSYEDVPANRIGQLELVRATPTLKFYKDSGNTIVVAIRGTKTMSDWTDANSRIVINQLENSQRYKNDLETIQQFQVQYPPSQYDYYGVGHSLGGAILDLFLKNGLIKNGVSYNPAVQPQDLKDTTLQNERIYSEGDPLYALVGPQLAKKPETRAPRKKSWWEQALSRIPYVGTAMKGYDLLQSHMLDQFEGGAKPHTKFVKQLRNVGIEPSLYLKEAQRKAKKAGLPYKVLGFADDGVHKLSIPNADGRMIRFGRVGYGDHLIWSHLEQQRIAPLGTADAKRNTFQKSHSAIKGDWKKDPFSPNSLALSVLW